MRVRSQWPQQQHRFGSATLPDTGFATLQPGRTTHRCCQDQDQASQSQPGFARSMSRQSRRSCGGRAGEPAPVVAARPRQRPWQLAPRPHRQPPQPAATRSRPATQVATAMAASPLDQAAQSVLPCCAQMSPIRCRAGRAAGQTGGTAAGQSPPLPQTGSIHRPARPDWPRPAPTDRAGFPATSHPRSARHQHCSPGPTLRQAQVPARPGCGP